jgi:hypothetical protein
MQTAERTTTVAIIMIALIIPAIILLITTREEGFAFLRTILTGTILIPGISLITDILAAGTGTIMISEIIAPSEITVIRSLTDILIVGMTLVIIFATTISVEVESASIMEKAVMISIANRGLA